MQIYANTIRYMHFHNAMIYLIIARHEILMTFNSQHEKHSNSYLMLNFLLCVRHETRPFVHFSIIYKNILLESRPILQITQLWLREANSSA